LPFRAHVLVAAHSRVRFTHHEILDPKLSMEYEF